MTGMKEGAGEDPFAEDSPSDDPPVSEDDTEPVEDRSPEDRLNTSSGTNTTGGGQVRIPYKFRRDGVQDGRDRVPLFLQPETKRAERDALHEVEERFDDDVSLTDLREAVVMVGLAHLDEVEDHLEGWGYGMTFD